SLVDIAADRTAFVQREAVMLESGDFPEGLAPQIVRRRSVGREHVDLFQAVGDALLFQRQPADARVDAVGRAEENRRRHLSAAPPSPCGTPVRPARCPLPTAAAAARAY